MISIRPATTADIPLIRSLAQIIFPETYDTILTPEQIDYMMQWMYSADSLRRQMEEEGHVYFLAEEDGAPCAYLSVQPEGDNTYHLQKIYLLPQCRGLGLGKRLFNHAVAYIKGIHPAHCQMRLNVNRHNSRALVFYKHMGMYELERGDFPIGGGFFMNDYIMALDIK